MLNSKFIIITNNEIDFLFKTIKGRIDGYHNFPPSKNNLIYGKSLKWQWIKMFRELNRDFIKYVENLQKQYKLFKVVIIFALTDEFFIKFEPQNYIEAILDAIFTPTKDHTVAECLFVKVPFQKNEIVVGVFPKELARDV